MHGPNHISILLSSPQALSHWVFSCSITNKVYKSSCSFLRNVMSWTTLALKGRVFHFSLEPLLAASSDAMRLLWQFLHSSAVTVLPACTYFSFAKPPAYFVLFPSTKVSELWYWITLKLWIVVFSNSASGEWSEVYRDRGEPSPKWSFPRPFDKHRILS